MSQSATCFTYSLQVRAESSFKDRARQNKFNAYYDEAQKAESKSHEFVCKQGGKWKLSLSKDMPIGVSTEFTLDELNSTSEDRKKDVERIKASRKRKQ